MKTDPPAAQLREQLNASHAIVVRLRDALDRAQRQEQVLRQQAKLDSEHMRDLLDDLHGAALALEAQS